MSLMISEKVVIIGASGHGKVIADILELTGNIEILGFIDSLKNPGDRLLSYEVLGDEHRLIQLCQEIPNLKGFVAVGDNFTRRKVVDWIVKELPGFTFVNAIHPEAIVSQYVELGQGVAIIGGAVVNSGARLEDHCIVNTMASIGHDSHLERYSSVAPGANIGGGTRIGELSAICIGSVVSNNLQIGKNTVVGAGSLVLDSFGENQLAFGNPARVIRSRRPDEPYL